MNDRSAKGIAPAEPPSADVDAATRRLLAALDALESAAERRRDADRDEDELASRIQALGTDRSRLADELDASLVKSRRLERSNREVAERLDAAIGTIRAVLDGENEGGESAQKDEREHQQEHKEEHEQEHEEDAETLLHAGALNEDEDGEGDEDEEEDE